jgi:hypothetical protein
MRRVRRALRPGRELRGLSTRSSFCKSGSDHNVTYGFVCVHDVLSRSTSSSIYFSFQDKIKMSFSPIRNNQRPSGYKQGPLRRDLLPSQSGINFITFAGRRPVRPPQTPSSPPQASSLFPTMDDDRGPPPTNFQQWGGQAVYSVSALGISG